MKTLFPTLAAAVLLAGCASEPMRPEVRAALLAADEAALQRFSPCCEAWREIDFSRTISERRLEVQVGAPGTQVRRSKDRLAPVVGFRLPHDSPPYRIQFASYSPSKHGLNRELKRLYIRPDITYLDGDFRELETITDPLLCFGLIGGTGALWLRTTPPAGAAYVVLSPSVAQPYQQTDARRPDGPVMLGPLGAAIVNSIAEARKSYLESVAIGYLGLISVESVPLDAPVPGRCVEGPAAR